MFFSSEHDQFQKVSQWKNISDWILCQKETRAIAIILYLFGTTIQPWIFEIQKHVTNFFPIILSIKVTTSFDLVNCEELTYHKISYLPSQSKYAYIPITKRYSSTLLAHLQFYFTVFYIQMALTINSNNRIIITRTINKLILLYYLILDLLYTWKLRFTSVGILIIAIWWVTMLSVDVSYAWLLTSLLVYRASK